MTAWPMKDALISEGFFMFQFVTVIKEYATTQTGHSIDLVTESMSRRTWIPISAATLSMLLLKWMETG